MGYQALGKIGESTIHTTGVPSQKNVERGEAQLKLLASPQGTTWLELLESPRVQTLRGTTPLKPIVSPHGTTPLKPSARAWVLTSYYFGHIFLCVDAKKDAHAKVSLLYIYSDSNVIFLQFITLKRI